MQLADRQRSDAKVRVEAQVLPESDLAQFTAEIERRRGDLYGSRETAARAELSLKALILDSADSPLWNQTLQLEDPRRPRDHDRRSAGRARRCRRRVPSSRTATRAWRCSRSSSTPRAIACGRSSISSAATPPAASPARAARTCGRFPA